MAELRDCFGFWLSCHLRDRDEEGVRLNVKDLMNFNKTVPESGGTIVFIAR